MLKNSRFASTAFGFFMVLLLSISPRPTYALGPCHGRILNPVTDICWECLFPINIGPIKLSTGGQIDNRDPPPPLLCTCPAPPPIFIRLGVGISFWEPARMAEVVRTPMCFPSLGGITIGELPVPAGTHTEGEGQQGEAFYQVHWFIYPVLSWIGVVLQGACFVSESYDLQYFTEVDPLWDDDELNFLLNPEAALFANPLAQAACVADSVSAAATNFGLDTLFWCAGSQGSVFPLTGNHSNHISGIDSSLALVHTHLYRMHRMGLAEDTSTTAAMCMPLPQPIMRKTQYKQSMVYPVPQTRNGKGLGVPSLIWGSGREFPYAGEDFAYLVWRKRKCCAF